MAELIPRRGDYAEVLRAAFADVPFHKTLGLELVEIRPGFVSVLMTPHEGLEQHESYLHAGALIGLADAAAGAAAFTLMAEGERLLSANFAVSMLRPASTSRLKAEGRVVKAGKRLYFTEAKVYDAGGEAGTAEADEGKLLVSATITMSVA